MKENKTLGYLIVAVVLVLILILVEKPFGKKVSDQISEEAKIKKIKVLPGVTEKETSKLFISADDKHSSVTLYNVNGTWAVNEKGTAKADPAKMKELWDGFEKNKEAEIVSETPESLEKFNLGKMGTYLTFYDKAGKVSGELVVGRPGNDYMTAFARLPKSNQALLLPFKAAYYFAYAKFPDDWRDKIIISAKHDNIASIVTVGPKGKTRVERLSDGEWEILEPSKQPASKTICDNYARVISAVYASKFEDNDANKPLSEFGLNPPEWSITLNMKDHSTTPTLEVGKQGQTDEYYAKLKGNDQVFILRGYQYTQFCKDFSGLVPTPTPKPTEPPKTSAGAEPKDAQQLIEKAAEKAKAPEKKAVEEKPKMEKAAEKKAEKKPEGK